MFLKKAGILKKSKNIIAIDLGAGSCRLFLAGFDGSVIKTEEIYRFQNNAYFKDNTLFWDFKNMISHLKKGIEKAYTKAEKEIACIGIDGWGCDFGCLDENGELISDPVSYRDKRTEGIDKEFFSIITEKELFGETFSKTYSYNTLFQLYHIYKHNLEKAGKIKKILPIASLVNYFLCGEKSVDPSILSGSQFFNISEKQYIGHILKVAGIPEEILPLIKENGSLIGKAAEQNFFPDSVYGFPYVALVCCMDSCSAVTGIPLRSSGGKCISRSFFINSGTWSLIGTENKSPIVSEKIFESEYTNWCSFRDNYIFIRSFNGFYYLQEWRKIWENLEGKSLDYDQLKKELLPKKQAESLIDINSDYLYNTGTDFVKAFEYYFKKTSQAIPVTRSSFLSSIFQSLVLEYLFAYRELIELRGSRFDSLYMAGGGSMNEVFCQWLSDCLDVEVYTGFAEASINGNIITQLAALGEVNSLEEGREIIRNSFPLKVYVPSGKKTIDWNKMEQRYKAVKEAFF